MPTFFSSSVYSRNRSEKSISKKPLTEDDKKSFGRTLETKGADSSIAQEFFKHIKW